MKKVFVSNHKPARYVVVEVRAKRVYVRRGILGTRGTEELVKELATPLEARLASSAVVKEALAKTEGARSYKQDFGLSATDFAKLPATAEKSSQSAGATSAVDPLSTALAAHPAALAYVKKMRAWRHRHEMVLEKAPRKSAKVWRPRAPFAIVAGDIAIAGNVITGADDCDESALIVVGGVRAENLLNSPGAEVYVTGPLEVRGLAFLGTPDSDLTTFDAVSIGVVDRAFTTRGKPVRIGAKKKVMTEEEALERFETTTALYSFVRSATKKS